MRNLTPIILLTSRLRGSQFQREILDAHIFPTLIHFHDDHVMLEWQFTDPGKRYVDVQFFLTLRGKSRGWLTSQGSDLPYHLEEHQFVSRMLSQYVLGGDLLLRKPYVYDSLELDMAMKKLYD